MFGWWIVINDLLTVDLGADRTTKSKSSSLDTEQVLHSPLSFNQPKLSVWDLGVHPQACADLDGAGRRMHCG